ncbi:MAG: type I methionyl aminopeptidase [Chloroflexota bacterium]
MGIVIKSEREIEVMRQAGRIVAAVLAILAKEVKVGMKTRELDVIAEREIRARGGVPSFKGYHGFPASLCVSINDEVVHGIPGDKVINEGDKVSLDLGAIYQGFQGDAAVTVVVGKAGAVAKALVQATEGALYAGIEAARAGVHLGDVSAAIQHHAEACGFAVVREYTGHGIGRKMHEEPLIPNFGESGTGPVLRKGMALALEPMLNAGNWPTRVGSDGWVVLTADGSLSAHFEHTIAITDDRAEILTTLA